MLKAWASFPWERAPILPKISLTVQALIEGIKETAIKYLIEAFKQLKMMMKNQWICCLKIWRRFNDDRSLFYFPEIIKNSIGNHHYIGLVLLLI